MSKIDDHFQNIETCKNCGSDNIMNYCSDCGQPIFVKRFTLKAFFKIIFRTINIDKGFFLTLKLLFIKPGLLINNYLNGKTKSYFNPLKYLIIIAGLFALIMVQTGVIDTSIEASNEVIYNNSETLKQQQEIIEGNEEVLEFQKKWIEKFKQYINLVPFLLIPFTSLVTKWFYRSKKLFYGEFLIVNTYIFSQTFIITLLFIIPIVLLFPALGPKFPIISSISALIYISFALYKTFNGSIVVSSIKAIIIYLLGSILFYIFFIVCLILFILIIKLLGLNIIDIFN